MPKKRVVLTFPANLTELPLTYRLVKDFDLSINILKAKITPGEEGKIVLELSNGSNENILAGLDFLNQQGVLIEPMSKEIVLDEEECVHCGSCTGVCTVRALSLDDQGHLQFDKDECIVCEMCVNACPLRIIKVMF